MSEAIRRYIDDIVPVGWMMCSCGERRECRIDCGKVLDARRRSDGYIIDMFEKLAGAD